MKKTSKILEVASPDINRTAWDACVQKHDPGLLYMQSWFLDIMAPGWEALVQPDGDAGGYTAIMVLPCRRKWTISYLYQPYLAAQLGYVGPDNSPENMKRFFDAIPSRFRYWDFCMNERNPLSVPGYAIRRRRNRVLSLQQPYEALRDHFSDNCLRNIRKAETKHCFVQQQGAEGTEEAIALYARTSRFPPRPADLHRIKQLTKTMKEKRQLTVYTVRSEKGQLLSTAIFFWQDNRSYFLLPANAPAARDAGSSYALVNTFIKDHSNSPAILDFEGSDIASVDRFYAGFGAEERFYPSVVKNKLPWGMRSLKK